MSAISERLTVLFEDPFWVGLIEREEDGCYEVCRIVFGAEPKDNEVYEAMLCYYHQLRFSPSIQTSNTLERRINPKRAQRDINKQLHSGIGTKAQQALKLMQEQNKLVRKTKSREQHELEKEQRFTLRSEKKKQKHKGH